MEKILSVILAAGMGTRMKGYEGCKALLPLLPQSSPFEGKDPMLLNIIRNLPDGPKVVVIGYRKEDILSHTKDMGLLYAEQLKPDGTGGALLAAEGIIRSRKEPFLIVTMGDVPFVKRETYLRLVGELSQYSMVILGFNPEDKRQYGILEIVDHQVKRIVEWKDWQKWEKDRIIRFKVCNSGIYAIRRKELIPYLIRLRKSPHIVVKERKGVRVKVKEFFLTDIVEMMSSDGLKVGYLPSEDENEVMGVDDVESLIRAQNIYRKRILQYL